MQYQLVVPTGAEHVLRRLVDRLHRGGVPCYLAVLKDFGAASGAPLSFPLRGWTLALDMPRRAPGLAALLDGFDEMVAGVGGRVYLAKDCRLRRETLAAMYPELPRWRARSRRARSRRYLAVGPGRQDGPGRHRAINERRPADARVCWWAARRRSGLRSSAAWADA